MNCPVCVDSALAIADRQGVEIDYCPRCRGIWLDRGELDKLIERAEREAAASARPARPADDYERRQPERRYDDDDDDDDRRGRRRRGSLLGELFDF
ncbi:MAG: zf-TFIIB domain-containing protein [Thermoleophilia bacterium]